MNDPGPLAPATAEAPSPAAGESAAAPRPAAPHRHRPLEWSLAALLALVTLAIFLPTVRHGWLYYDDDAYVFTNPQVMKGLGPLTLGFRWSNTTPSVPIPLVHWPSVAWALTAEVQGNWHPLTMISHLIDASVYGMVTHSPTARQFLRQTFDIRVKRDEPWAGGHHLTSVMLHTLTVVLLFFTLCKWTGYPGRAFVVAALFAWHPTRVESVAWIAERKDVLAGLFWVLSMAAYGAYVRKPGVWRYLWVTFFLACGLLSKPMLVTLPFVFLLLDYWPFARLEFTGAGRRRFARLEALAYEKLPWFCLIGVMSWVAYRVQARQGFVLSLDQQTTFERIVTATNAYGAYLWNALWPVNLCLIYPLPKDVHIEARTIASALFLVGLSAAAWYFARRRPYFPVGWFWYLGTLVPVIGLVQIGAGSMADRYTYLPLIGIFIAVTWWIADRLAASRLSAPAAHWAGGVLATGVLSLMAVLCWRQVAFWRSPVALFQRAVDVTDENYVAYYNLGNALAANKRMHEAIAAYDTTLKIWPGYPAAAFNKALSHLRIGQFAEALELLRFCNKISPNDPNTLANLAHCLEKLGHTERAAERYNESLKLAYRDENALALGNLLHQLGRTDEAIALYQHVLRVSPGRREALTALAWIYATHHKSKYRNPEMALTIAKQVVDSLPPNARLWAAANDTLGAAYAANGQFEDALRHARIAYRRLVEERRACADAGLDGAAADADEQAKAVLRRIDYYTRREPYFVDATDHPR